MVTKIHSTSLCKISKFIASKVVRIILLFLSKPFLINILYSIGQDLCTQTYPEDCHYFVYDKKNCQCKLMKVNNPNLLPAYNEDCRKLGGFKKPSLEMCPAFEEISENSCKVKIFLFILSELSVIFNDINRISIIFLC